MEGKESRDWWKRPETPHLRRKRREGTRHGTTEKDRERCVFLMGESLSVTNNCSRVNEDPLVAHLTEEKETAQSKPCWNAINELSSTALAQVGITISETDENVPRTPKLIAKATEIS